MVTAGGVSVAITVLMGGVSMAVDVTRDGVNVSVLVVTTAAGVKVSQDGCVVTCEVMVEPGTVVVVVLVDAVT